MSEKLDQAVGLAKELNRAVYKLYLGYPPDGTRYSQVSTKAVQLLKGIDDRFQTLFEAEIYPDIHRMKVSALTDKENEK